VAAKWPGPVGVFFKSASALPAYSSASGAVSASRVCAIPPLGSRKSARGPKVLDLPLLLAKKSWHFGSVRDSIAEKFNRIAPPREVPSTAGAKTKNLERVHPGKVVGQEATR